MSIICVNTKKIKQKKNGIGSIKASMSVISSAKATLRCSSAIIANSKGLVGFNVKLLVTSTLKGRAFIEANAPVSINADTELNAKSTVSCSLKSKAQIIGKINSGYVEKLGGNFSLENYRSFNCLDTLYPIEDIEKSIFLNNNLSYEDLYNSIDGGVIEGTTALTYIQPSSTYTDASFTYKCKITNPVIRPKDSFIKIRAAAPTSNLASQTAPRYTISNIKLEDPSGNLIVKYKDFSLLGESNFDQDNILYSTYISEPEINNTTKHTWSNNYPILTGSGYTLSLNFTSECLDDPFNFGFDKGYEEKLCTIDAVESDNNNYLALDGAPLSTQYQGVGLNPIHSLRIAAIELCNSGELVTFTDYYLPFYSEVSPTGQRIRRSILPVHVVDNTFDTNIYPSSLSTWVSSPDIDNNTVDNTTSSGTSVLTQYLRDKSTSNYISLLDSSVSDSGKLTLKFSHDKPAGLQVGYLNGEFELLGNLNPDGTAFNTAEVSTIKEDVSFFTIDSVELKVVAKKAAGSRDYVLDIVGYSDDKLLNITSAVGGFLQNTTGSGIIPVLSGVNPIDELGISSEAIADKTQYFEKQVTNNAGGDHYQLAISPVINSTTFEEYTIPLAIYPDLVELGKSKDYSMSSYFESLYLDIYPIPSGASIASIELIVSFKPSNAMVLHTTGQTAAKELNNRDVRLYPSQRKENDLSINNGNVYAPLSQINNIPHAYTFPDTLKTNYSRRWRGVDGTVVNGPYDPREFDPSFENPPLSYPFLHGYFSFNNDIDNWVISDDLQNLPVLSGQYVGNYNKLHNIGLRFSSQSLFDSPTNYTTIDWTSISGYETDSLYGKIADAFDNAVRVSGNLGYIDFGNINTASGFAIFTRFSPDITISGVGYNLFNSGVLFAKHDVGKNLEFSLGFNNGHLEGKARASDGTIYTVQDNFTYDQYSYPLSVIFVYNDTGDNKLHLYTDDEHHTGSEFNRIRDQSQSFELGSGDSSFIIGNSFGSNIGINAFITDIGISLGTTHGHTNIVRNETQADKQLKQISASRFLDSLHMKFWSPSESYVYDTYKLWDYVDNDISDWHLGAFKICSFNHEYDRFTKRAGLDYLVHRLAHHGSGYLTDLALPANLSSGICYHSQIENDSLRFNIGALPDSFNDVLYSPLPRISKNLPKGYNFTEEALCVETIIEHDINTNVIWTDGHIGPKLVVSLYTTNKDPISYPATNYGLINRHTHYLDPSGCWHKLTSVFDFNNLMDTSEPWSNFEQSKNLTEFNHKYFSKDIDDMFLQYDVVYPSGESFDSSIKIHSANVKLANALIESRSKNDNVNLYASGQAIRYDNLNMFVPASVVIASGLNLAMSGGLMPTHSGTINLYCSGMMMESKTLNLYTINYDTIASSGDVLGHNLFIQGMTNQFDEKILPLFLSNKLEDQSSSGTLLLTAFSRLPKYSINDNIALSIRGSSQLVNFVPKGFINLFLAVDKDSGTANADLNLFVDTFNPNLVDETISLFTVNYQPQSTASQALLWNNQNVGKNIDSVDNVYASLDADDEIRGVDLICYGDCSTNGCNDKKLITHETEWQPQECVDGGIFRAYNTYTNLATSGFNTNVGYSGHFYGIRKFDGLIPSAPYNIVVKGKTAQEQSLRLHGEIEEWEYGFNNNVGYSGVKIVANSGNRNANDEFGSSVAIKNSIMAIGAPMHDIYDSEGYYLENAGAVFVYNRLPQPSGYDWSTDKAGWEFVTKLSLPSGYIRDYVSKEVTKEFFNGQQKLPFTAQERIWKVGQEGRQFGHSVDICSTNNLEPSLLEDNKNLIIVGGPSVKWTRDFEDLTPSGVNIGLFIFTDEFTPEIIVGTYPRQIKYNYLNILEAIKEKDILFKYFSNPPVSFNIKLIICETLANSNRIPQDFPEPKPSFIIKQVINRHSSDQPGTAEFNTIDNEIFTDIQSAFYAAFPYDNTKINNNIPCILGFYIDDSRSAGGEDAIQPALNNFIAHYQEYSFASGLNNFFGVPSSGSVSKYIADDENWVIQSNIILDQTLDTGRLFTTEQYQYFTSGIGDFNPELSDFNAPPASGGCVYIFERESGVWNLIQTIESPTESNIIFPDRFGHAVDISDNGEIIVVGSPYINDALNVYQYNKDEKTRLYDNVEGWITYKKNLDTSFGYYYNMYNRYYTLRETYNKLEASKILYLELTPTAKYDLRSNFGYWGDNPISEYEKIFTYSYSNIDYGSWKFLVEEFAPTSRLGYSVAVNEDGSIIAAGAPTDSFDELDSAATYYAPNRPSYTTWPSYVNTGAVRVFESRKYYPHNLAVEYGKFGNLEYDRRLDDEDQFFNHMEDIYNQIGIPFIKTEFTEEKIPQQAGLAYIITPYIDALSDEILNNIKEWLSFGDRNLVLVGNDPIWEEDGIYASSNTLINKILESLQSRLRIVAARSQSEALVPRSGINDRVNIIESFTPSKSRNVNVSRSQLTGFGVADIKPFWPEAQRTYNCSDSTDQLSLSSIFNRDLSYGSANDKCEIPIINLGDLRSEWKEWCVDLRGEPITYSVNWPLYFGSVKQREYGCADDDASISPTFGYDAVPILVAAEYPEPYDVVYPAIPEGSSLQPVSVAQNIVGFGAEFASHQLDSVAFIWDSGGGNYTYLSKNINNTNSTSAFFDPPFYNDKDGVLQAKASNKIISTKKEKVVSDYGYFGAEETYANTNSKLVLLAGTFLEGADVLYSGTGDNNINFYFNLVAKNTRGGSYIAQLGDWTGRSSFTDANPNSILQEVFINTFNVVKLDVSTEELTETGHPSGFEYDVCWIANPTGLPSSDQIDKIKNWLARGNKKLIITYAHDENSVLTTYITKQLCEIFNVSMTPLYLTERSKYAISNIDIVKGQQPAEEITVNPNNFISQGFNPSKDSIESLPVEKFIPIALNNATALAYTFNKIVDDDFVSVGTWQLKTGVTEIKFPTIPGSGYKVFVNVASEHYSENEPFTINFAGCSLSPSLSNYSAPKLIDIIDVDNETDQPVIVKEKEASFKVTSIYPDTFNGDISTKTYNLQAASNSITMYIDANNVRLSNTTTEYTPRTTRLISISGCLLPINQVPYIQYVDIYDWVVTPEIPEKTVTVIPELRPISTINDKYCPSDECIPTLGNKLIADGPVVVAQELEIISNFENGVSRSRITIISDSSLVQGRNMVDSEKRIPSNNINFMQSLYPFTTFPSNNRGRTFGIANKIQCPERTTPQRLFNSYGNVGLNFRFNVSGVADSGRPMSDFIESFDGVDNFVPALHPTVGKSPDYLQTRELAFTGDTEALLSGIKEGFKSQLNSWGAYTKFNMEYNGEDYLDASVIGGIPRIMQDTNHDYLDFDFFKVGYPGDLFGYSIALYKNKLIIGSPFATYEEENITNWSDVVSNTSEYEAISGTKIGYNGGAGSVYVYERTGSGLTPFGRTIPWECTQKLRPESINIGQDTIDLDLLSSGFYLGSHNYTGADVTLDTKVNDQFGYSVAIDGDIIAVGSPGHDFGNYITYSESAFMKKSFGRSFDIQQPTIYDLGSSGIRNTLNGSGISVLNNGAIFTYENKITNWNTKEQNWVLVQKLIPQGYNSRVQKAYEGSELIVVSGTENDRFGSCIAIDKQNRTDSDYSIMAGSKSHIFGSGVSDSGLLNAGTAYIYDAMLRSVGLSYTNPESFIHASVFGTLNSGEKINLYFKNNNEFDKTYYATGIIYSNNKGEIFLEASGQDLNNKGFTQHRPYIVSVDGSYVFGTAENNAIRLFSYGKEIDTSGHMSLFSNAADSDIVYNTIGLYQNAILGTVSGTPILPLYVDCPLPSLVENSGLFLSTSGIGFVTDTLNMRIRGK